MLLYSESYVFLLGLIFMFVVALWFFANRKRNEFMETAFLVISVTTLSYALLFSGSITALSESGVPIYFTRWLFYIGSCSLLMLTIGKILNVKNKNILAVLIFNSLVMLSGALAAVATGYYKWIIFVLGSVFFIGQLIILFENAPKGRPKKLMSFYILFGWALFPVIFIFAPEGAGFINNFAAAILYLLLDLFTKVIFYFHITRLSPARAK